MFLLYHAYVYLEFLILACTIYILAPSEQMNQSGHEKPDFDVWGQKAPPKQQSGGRKRPQNVKVGAKSAPAIWTRQNPD